MKVAVLTHAGGAHLSAYFSALAESKDCDELVIADPDNHWDDEARKLLGDKLTRTYTEYTQLLQKESPKLCMVSMEAGLAPPVIEAALDSGSHVFAEKPGCVTLQQFEK
jgi:predicted dehydrogenase